MGGDEGGVPAATVFDDAALCGIINVDQAEALAVALGPLKVVQKGPDDVALDGHILAYDLGNGLNVPLQVVYTLLVVNVAVAVPVIVESGATFGDNQGFWGVLVVNARQDVGEAIREDLPAHCSVGRAQRFHSCQMLRRGIREDSKQARRQPGSRDAVNDITAIFLMIHIGDAIQDEFI